jgi:Zn ribbon nucleic-acid-binding protein
MAQPSAVPDMPAARDRLTLEDLGPWHVLAVMCTHCSHTGQVAPASLRRHFRANQRIQDLEPRMRCTRCGRRGEHGWVVLRLPRNT